MYTIIIYSNIFFSKTKNIAILKISQLFYYNKSNIYDFFEFVKEEEHS